MFGHLSPEEVYELREERIRYEQQLKQKEASVRIPYRPPRVTVRKTYRPKGMIAAFINQCKPTDCFPTPKKKNWK